MLPDLSPKYGKVAIPGNRLYKLDHRNVTIPLRTRWLTPAGLCSPTRKFGAFSSRQTSLVAKPRDALDTHRHPKRFTLGSKAQNYGTTPKHVPCSETLQKRHFRVFVPPRGFGEKRQWQWHEKPDHRVPMCLEANFVKRPLTSVLEACWPSTDCAAGSGEPDTM